MATIGVHCVGIGKMKMSPETERGVGKMGEILGELSFYNDATDCAPKSEALNANCVIFSGGSIRGRRREFNGDASM